MYSKYIVPFLQASLLLILFVLSQTLKPLYRAPKQTMQNSAIHFNPLALKFFSLGHRSLVANLFWIETLIKSDTNHYTSKDLNNWMYLRFSNIVYLYPKFKEAYVFGGQYLAVIKDDPLSAIALLQKGVHVFPHDYQTNFLLGFIYYYDLKKEEQALSYLDKVKFYPEAPYFMPSLVAKIKAHQNEKENAFLILQEAYNKAPEGSFIKDFYAKKIKKLKDN